ncbi:MAG: alpha/beta hydrolase-fold protein [Microbacterium sp.]
MPIPDRTPGGFSNRLSDLELEYFEIDSERVGDRFALSVSLPNGHAEAEGPLPVVYALDAQFHGGLYEKLHRAFSGAEAAVRMLPFVQVNVGYPTDTGVDPLITRNRDLVPPNEPVPEVLREFMQLHADAGLGDEGVETFFAMLENTHADRFLGFLEEELHPQIVDAYGVHEKDAGLFGFSYGGLFAIYALVSGGDIFSRFGAASPGLMGDEASMFGAYREFARSQDGTARERGLHLTIGGAEMWGPHRLLREMGIQTARFYDLTQNVPTPNLSVTADYFAGEDHETGAVDAYRSFVRRFYTA